MAAIFRIAEPLGGTLMLLGIAPNSIGLVVREFLALSSLPEESPLYKDAGPHMIADYLAKVKSMSSSYGPLFLKGILNFWAYCPFLITRGTTFSLNSDTTSSFWHIKLGTSILPASKISTFY